MEKECKHTYVSERAKNNTTKSNYIGNGRSEVTPVEGETIVIFCTKCGGSKQIFPPTPQ